MKIVPYYVIKNPSEPSLIGSPISYIALLPGSLSSIQQSIQILIPIKHTEIISAEKAIVFDILFDIRVENKNINIKGVNINNNLIGCIFSGLN